MSTNSFLFSRVAAGCVTLVLGCGCLNSYALCSEFDPNLSANSFSFTCVAADHVRSLLGCGFINNYALCSKFDLFLAEEIPKPAIGGLEVSGSICALLLV